MAAGIMSNFPFTIAMFAGRLLILISLQLAQSSLMFTFGTSGDYHMTPRHVIGMQFFFQRLETSKDILQDSWWTQL